MNKRNQERLRSSPMESEKSMHITVVELNPEWVAILVVRNFLYVFYSNFSVVLINSATFIAKSKWHNTITPLLVQKFDAGGYEQ